MNCIPLIKKAQTEEDFTRLANFASQFGHTANDRQVPIFTMEREGEIRGYAQVHTETPIVFTAWHNNTVKDLLFGMTYLKGFVKISKGGGLLAVPISSESFTPEILEKLNMKRLGLELYQTGE